MNNNHKISSPSNRYSHKTKNMDGAPLTVRSLIRCIKSVRDVAIDIDKSIFDEEIPTESSYRKKILKHKNVCLTNDDLGLDRDILGAVFKRESDQTRVGKNIYLIYISNVINDPLRRLFVLCHEFAHVLLHGRLMHPGMMLNLSSQEWRTDCTAIKQIEAEANIFSMMTIIPNELIEYTIDQSLTTSETHFYIRATIESKLGQATVTNNLIRDRLLIYKLGQSETWNVSLEDAIDTTGIRSWIFRDANYSNRTHLPD